VKEFNLTIVTPEKVTFEGKVEYLGLPAWEGSLGVLSGHISSLVLLQEGVVVLRKSQGTDFLAVSGGFAEISPQRAIVFAETAELAGELDVERAKLALQRAKDIALKPSTKETPEEIDIEVTRAALRRALVRLKTFEMYSRHKKSGPVFPNQEN